MAVGKSKRLTLNREAGHYVLLCDLSAHYTAGMRANLTVK